MRKGFFLRLAVGAVIAAVVLLGWMRLGRSHPHTAAASSTPALQTSSQSPSPQSSAPSAQTPHFDDKNQAIAERVKKILVEHLGVDPSQVTPNAKFKDDLAADDLDMAELVLTFEEAFNLDISDEDAEKLVTVKDAIDYIELQVSKKTSKQ